MYKKIISTLVIGTLLAGTLTGCGGSSDAGSSAKSSGKTELELFSSKAENKDILQKLVDKFKETHEDVTIKITAPADAGTVILHKILFGFLNPKRLDRVAFPPDIM